MKMSEYIKKDLDKYADFDGFEEQSLFRRDDALEYVLPESADIHSEKIGSYQGDIVIIVRFDSYWWFTDDSYGSCAGCDFFMSDSHEWTEQQLREFYCFGTLDDLENYVEETDVFRTLREDEIREASLNLISKLNESEAAGGGNE